MRQVIVDALSSAPAPSLRTVGLSVHFRTGGLDLSPLVQLSQLSDLRMSDPSLAQCAIVKQLAALTRLHVSSHIWDRDALLELLRPPHALQRLQQASFAEQTLDLPLFAALLSLPALDSPAFDGDRAGVLGRPQQLRPAAHTAVSWPEPFTAAQRSALESSVHSLPRLTDSRSISKPFDSESAAPPFAPRLPAPRSLDLRGLRLPSLTFLRRSPRSTRCL
jgi:hypothetical protein